MTELEAIYHRRSIRSYRNDHLEPALLTQVRELLTALPTAPFGTETRLSLLLQSGGDTGAKLGTYGFIKGARHFISGTVSIADPMALEDFGYTLERVILRLTALGLGSCWLGASFRKGAVKEQLNPKRQEMIPAVTPLGWPSDRISLRESLTRRLIKPHTRMGMERLFFQNRPGQALTSEWQGFLPLELVRLAPSAENRQPWRIVVSEKRFDFFLERNRSLQRNSRLMGWADMQRLDMGIAMAHFDIGAQSLDWNGVWQRDDPAMPDTPPGWEYRVTYCR